MRAAAITLALLLSALAAVRVASRQPPATFAEALRDGPLSVLVGGLLVTGLAAVRARARSLRRDAATDDLTGLSTHRAFFRQVEATLRRAGREQAPVTVLMIELDGFKQLNDTMGHAAGDLLLRQLGPRLRRALGSADAVARLSGDEFAAVFSGVADPRAAREVADHVRVALRQPFVLGTVAVHVNATVGIAMFPAHAANADDLLQRADVAMYHAKQARSECEVYDPRRDLNSRELLALAGELHRALGRHELDVYYQPKAQLRTGRVVAVEALVRWRHPERGVLAPAQFLPLVEQSGLTRPVTRYVLDAALAQLARWREDGRDLRVAVNISCPDLLDARFPEQVRAALRRHALPPSALQLEITENTVLADPERVLDVLARLSESGIELALDDFGTGQSSLAYLKRLPVRELKIDRAFMLELTPGSTDETIVSSTIELAHRLGLTVTAEGVETLAAWQALAAMDCDLAQGVLLSPPLPTAELDGVLDRVHPATTGPAPLADVDDAPSLA